MYFEFEIINLNLSLIIRKKRKNKTNKFKCNNIKFSIFNIFKLFITDTLKWK